MNPKIYRKLEGVIGKDSYLASLAREDLAKKGFTELDDQVVEKAAEVHEAQMDAIYHYMRKNTVENI